jgi:hypothetical protein
MLPGSRVFWWSWIPLRPRGNGVASDPLAWVLLAIVLGDSNWFELLGIGFVSDVGGEGGEAVVIIVIVVLVDTVPSPCFDNTLRIVAIIDLLPEVDRRSIVKAGLEWSLALRPCTMLVARLASRLLYFLFIVVTCGRVALVALATVVPPVLRPPLGVRLISIVSPWCSNLKGKF